MKNKKKQLYFTLRCLLLIGLTLFSGCSMKYSFTGAAISPSIKTVSVSYFQNRSPLAPPAFSEAITEALKRKLVSETSLIVVPSDGDIQFEGEIVEYTQTSTAPQANQTSGLNRLTAGVKFRFINNKEIDRNIEDRVSKYRDYLNTVSIPSIEGQFMSEVSKQIVDEIFLKALAGW